MKKLTTLLFISLASSSAMAGVALHCEQVTSNQYVCDLLPTGNTNISHVNWSAVTPLNITAVNNTFSAILTCAGNHSSGGVSVSYFANGIPGSASYSTACNSTSGGDQGDSSIDITPPGTNCGTVNIPRPCEPRQ